MYQTEKWKIVAPRKGIRIYQEHEVKFFEGQKVQRSSELNEHIEETWKIEKQKNLNLTNGKLLRLEKFVDWRFGLDLYISLTDYQEYKATCFPEHKQKFEGKYGLVKDNEKANTFASAVLPITLDDKIVFLIRSSNVDQFKGFLNLPSGGKWDGNPEKTFNALLDYSGNLFQIAKKIVNLEFNEKIKLGYEKPKLYGLAQTLEHNENPFDNHVLQFSVLLNESSDDILRKKDKIAKGKYKDIEIVNFSPADLADFVNKNLERIPESIQPVLISVGANTFGIDWPLSIKRIKK